MLLTPHFLHVFTHGFATLRRVAAFDRFLELGTLFLCPRVARLFSRVFSILRMAVKEGVLQLAAFHHRDVGDLLSEGITVKFGSAHDLSGNLHKLRFSNALDAAAGFRSTSTAPICNLAGLAQLAGLGLSPAGASAGAAYHSGGER